MGVRKKVVNGQEYYYLEKSIRLEAPKVYSVFLGKLVPNKAELNKKRMELVDKIYEDLLNNAKTIYLTKEQLIEVEKHRRRYVHKLEKMSKSQLDEKDEVDIVNFIYTTLTTEGVPVTREDASLAYKLTENNVKNVRDENLRVALDMMKGLRFVKESKKGISLEFLLKLHNLIMSEYAEKNPGKFRQKQAYIYLKSLEKVEEISFRPSAQKEIEGKLAELVKWFNENIGKLNAIELAALLHLRFYIIHPFEDGNKRMSRLLMNKAFFDSGYPILNISKETQSYFDALIKSIEKKTEKPFVEFVYRRFIDGI